MVTWTFDLVALLIGFAVGFLLGGVIYILVEMRDGGQWAKGFFEGCDKKALISYLEHEKEEMRGSTKPTKDVKP